MPIVFVSSESPEACLGVGLTFAQEGLPYGGTRVAPMPIRVLASPVSDHNPI